MEVRPESMSAQNTGERNALEIRKLNAEVFFFLCYS